MNCLQSAVQTTLRPIVTSFRATTITHSFLFFFLAWLKTPIQLLGNQDTVSNRCALTYGYGHATG